MNSFGQVLSFRLRSSIPPEIPPDLIPKHPNESVEFNGQVYREMDYCTLLNKVLPADIRVLGWSEVTDEFNARFSSTYRRYRYFFVKRQLDIDLMHEAAQSLVGVHNFQNFCKIDVENVINFVREIFFAKIELFYESTNKDESMYMLELQGIAFLWHMVRCIMAVLFLIGEHKESKEIVTKLLDVESLPSKPQYMMAADFPLVLHECGFDRLRIHWQANVVWSLTKHFEEVLDRHAVAMARARNSLNTLKSCQVRRKDVTSLIESLRTTLQKKKKGRVAPAEAVDEAILPPGDEILMWSEALELMSAAQLLPTSDTMTHVPLLQVHTFIHGMVMTND